MNSLTKKRILIIAVIALLLINITALVTMSVHKYKYRSSHQDVIQTKECAQNNGFKKSKGRHYLKLKKYVARELSMSNEQYEQYSRLKDLNIKNTDSLFEQIRYKRAETFNEFCKEKQDNKKIEKLSVEIGLLHQSVQNEMIRHFDTVLEILNPEQKVKFKALVCRMSYPAHKRAGKDINRYQFNKKENCN